MFIDALTNHNHARLVKHGVATKGEIEQAWQNLFFEYCDASDSESYRHQFMLTKEINRLRSRLLAVEMALRVMNIIPLDAARKVLKSEGYDYRFNYEDPVGYKRDLETVSTKMQTIIVALKEKEFEYNQATKDFEKHDTTGNEFENALVHLGKYMGGGPLNPREITVSIYLACLRAYKQEAQQLEKANIRLHGKKR